MSNTGIPAIFVRFADAAIDLQRGGRFEIQVSDGAREGDNFLVIDVYDIENPVHPEGHVGWWRFPLPSVEGAVAGMLRYGRAGLKCEIEGTVVQDSWVNEKRISCKTLVVNAVLRATVTNAIVYLDWVPAFRKTSDISVFRGDFERDWNSPKYATPGFIFPRKGAIRLLARNVFVRDAVGKFCLETYRLLRQNGVQAEIYAEVFDVSLGDVVRRQDRIGEEVSVDDTIVCFFSTFEPALEKILELPAARKIAYFHSVTPPRFLQVFDPELAAVCAKAYAQLPLLDRFDVLAGNSAASLRELLAHFDPQSRWSADSVHVVPPVLVPQQRGLARSAKRTRGRRQQSANLLYVGRVKSHKKIEDLLRLFYNYLPHCEHAELWIVGSADDRAYMDYLRWVETEELKLPPGRVRWFGSVPQDRLDELYEGASAYVSMSEHEGFCVPLVEAMLAGLPVFAFGLPAVREVMGGAGVFFAEKDFEHLAHVIHSMLVSDLVVQEIVARQAARVAELARAMDGSRLLELFAPRLDADRWV